MERNGYVGLALIALATVIAVTVFRPAGTNVPATRGDGDVGSYRNRGDSASSATPAPGADPAGESSFSALTSAALSELPRKSDLTRLRPEEAHGTPEAIDAAGLVLGRVAAALAGNRALAPIAAAFYKDCAEAGEVLSSVRALCYSNLERLAASGAEGIVADPRSLPEGILELARRLRGWK